MRNVAYCALAHDDKNGMFVVFVVAFWLDQQFLTDYGRPNKFIYVMSFQHAFFLVLGWLLAKKVGKKVNTT